MGTHAVIHMDMRSEDFDNGYWHDRDIWIATHGDCSPEVLGKELRHALAVVDEKTHNYFTGSFLQEAVLGVAGRHEVSAVSILGLPDFMKAYEYGEVNYEYTVDVRKLIVRCKALPSGSFGETHDMKAWLRSETRREQAKVRKELEREHADLVNSAETEGD